VQFPPNLLQRESSHFSDSEKDLRVSRAPGAVLMNPDNEFALAGNIASRSITKPMAVSLLNRE
jgi:hypothetical protein